MQNQENLFKKIISHCKEYGFIFPSSEIYDGLSAVYDYGQYGVELKNNIRDYWWRSMVQLHENIVGIDSAIFMHPKVWQASGHIESFNDPMIDNKDSKKRYRADELIEDHLDKINQKIQKEVEKAEKRFGEAFDKEQFMSTHPKVKGYRETYEHIRNRFIKAMEMNDLNGIKQIIIDAAILDPVSGSANWTDVRQFNLMFSTKIGSLSDGASEIYLRPETAQGIFINFLNILKSGRMKLPFGIAQCGKAFRNEIVARQFIIRMREFEQMEMQFFVKPGEEMQWFHYWKELRMKWHLSLGIPKEKFRFHEHEKLAHYANAAFDIEYEFPFGFKELEGIHSRTDFDLKAHQTCSNKKMQYFDPEMQESYIPYVVETSIGLDRMFLAIISSAFREETLADGSSRLLLDLPPVLAPVKVAILPLLKKDGLAEKARKILDELRFYFHCQYDEKDAIGRRYRRQDAIGTPYAITIDHQSMEDDTVTLRYRNSMEQRRVNISELTDEIRKELDFKAYFDRILH
jgi:glycyl-tRNA synthetase